MQRPEVRIIDNQQITTSTPDIIQSEADYLLAKYGYKQVNTTSQPIQKKQQPQTFEEMIRQQENEKKRKEEERIRRTNGPKPVSFDERNINYSETKYSDMEIGNSSLGIKVQIVTDMKIN